uniref:Uncharacterized protein n=1 Tax=Arundo donax TaxID=35708 RepID=A0A0A9AF53_ARUDO
MIPKEYTSAFIVSNKGTFNHGQ